MKILAVAISVLLLTGCLDALKPEIDHQVKVQRVQSDPVVVEVAPIHVEVDVAPIEPLQVKVSSQPIQVSVKLQPLEVSVKTFDLKVWQVDGIIYVGKMLGDLVVACEPLDPFAVYPTSPTEVGDLEEFRTAPKTITETLNCAGVES